MTAGALTLSRYVERRTGLPLGAPGSLRNMLHRSLGAGSFAGFWLYWNPIWGYYLGRYVNAPLRRLVPAGPALVLTFLASGAVHDVVIMAVRRSIAILFVPWFGLLGVVVVLTSWAGLDYRTRPWGVRAILNLALVLGALAITLAAKSIFGIP